MSRRKFLCEYDVLSLWYLVSKLMPKEMSPGSLFLEQFPHAGELLRCAEVLVACASSGGSAQLIALLIRDFGDFGIVRTAQLDDAHLPVPLLSKQLVNLVIQVPYSATQPRSSYVAVEVP